jgi:MarR family transcriptional regulator, organic hydroperoxide resistance regulator
VKPWQKAIPKDRLAHIIKDATRGLVRALSVRLAEAGVSFGHWTFLRILWERDGLTQRELSEEAGVMEPTTFSALKSMEDLGYVARRQMPENRKNVYVFLTPHGRALKEKLVPLAEEVNRVAMRGVAPEDAAAMRRALALMLQNLAADAALSRSSPRRPSPASRTSGNSRGSARYRRPA